MPEVTVRAQPSRIGTGVLAVVVPLAVAGAAYGLWFLSDRLVHIGPLDRASFGWTVVFPTWAAAPVAAGFAWRGLPSAARSIAATICGLVVGAALTVLFWLDVSAPDCQFGPVRAPVDWSVQAIAIGLLIGGGFAIAGVVATRFAAAGRPWLALFGGATIQLGAAALAILFFWSQMISGVCQRPPA
jgi:hypothetical protein